MSPTRTNESPRAKSSATSATEGGLAWGAAGTFATGGLDPVFCDDPIASGAVGGSGRVSALDDPSIAAVTGTALPGDAEPGAGARARAETGTEAAPEADGGFRSIGTG